MFAIKSVFVFIFNIHSRKYIIRKESNYCKRYKIISLKFTQHEARKERKKGRNEEKDKRRGHTEESSKKNGCGGQSKNTPKTWCLLCPRAQ